MPLQEFWAYPGGPGARLDSFAFWGDESLLHYSSFLPPFYFSPLWELFLVFNHSAMYLERCYVIFAETQFPPVLCLHPNQLKKVE